MTFKQLAVRARRVRELYAAAEIQRTGRPWSPSELAQGFAGDVGQLMKLVMAKAGRRVSQTRNLDEALAHELSDCLWSVLVLADAYHVDLERAFNHTMNELEQRLTPRRRTKTARSARGR